MRNYFPVLCCFLLFVPFLGGCGFQPLYGSYGTDTALLENIQIDHIHGRHGQQLRNNLVDRLHRKGTPQNARYLIKATPPQFNQTALGLDKDTTAETRFQLLVTSSYELIDRETGDSLRKRQLRSFVAYNALESQFTTIITRQDAFDRGIRQIADRMVMDIALYFGNDAYGEKPENDTVEIRDVEIRDMDD